MSVFVLILKIIGIIFLSIIVLLLLALLAVLFCPVKFRFKGSYYEKLDGEVKGHWLFHIISFHYWYQSGELNGYWRLFSKRHPLNDTEDVTKDVSKVHSKDLMKESIAENEEKHNKDEEIFEKNEEKEVIVEKEVIKEKNNTNQKKKRKRKKKVKASNKVKSAFMNIISMFKRIKEIVTNEAYQKGIKHILNELVILIKHVLPKKTHLEMDYSCGSPDKTAMVIGFIACFPIAYQNNWNIHPDFDADKGYFRGKTAFKGRLVPYVLVRGFLRIFIDKNCRKLYNDFSN